MLIVLREKTPIDPKYYLRPEHPQSAEIHTPNGDYEHPRLFQIGSPVGTLQ